MRLEVPPRTRSRIGLTPLIDVVFLLLVFFILAGRFEHDSLRPIRFAGSDPAPAPAEPEPFVLVSLDAAGGLRLNGEPLDPALLETRIADLARRLPGLQVAFDPSPALTLQDLIDWLDRLETSGAAGVRLLPREG